MPLKLKLWLGRLVGWDKESLRVLLVISAITIALLLGPPAFNRVEDFIDPDPQPVNCDSQCIDDIVNDIDIDRIVNDTLRETR